MSFPMCTDFWDTLYILFIISGVIRTIQNIFAKGLEEKDIIFWNNSGSSITKII